MNDDGTRQPDPELIERTRALFLREDNTYGCAETALVALQEQFGFPHPKDSSPAMALNGGIAYSGSTCGAITGAALAVGRLAEQRIDDHRDAKRAARRIIQRLMVDFEAEYGSVRCRELTGYDMLRDHDAFLSSGVWEDSCMRQIEFSVSRLARLADPREWDAELQRVTAGDAEISA